MLLLSEVSTVLSHPLSQSSFTFPRRLARQGLSSVFTNENTEAQRSYGICTKSGQAGESWVTDLGASASRAAPMLRKLRSPALVSSYPTGTLVRHDACSNL